MVNYSINNDLFSFRLRFSFSPLGATSKPFRYHKVAIAFMGFSVWLPHANWKGLTFQNELYGLVSIFTFSALFYIYCTYLYLLYQLTSVDLLVRDKWFLNLAPPHLCVTAQNCVIKTFLIFHFILTRKDNSMNVQIHAIHY